MQYLLIAALVASSSSASSPVQTDKPPLEVYMTRKQPRDRDSVGPPQATQTRQSDNDIKLQLQNLANKIDNLQNTQKDNAERAKSDLSTAKEGLTNLINSKTEDLTHQIQGLDKLIYWLLALLSALMGGALYIARELSGLKKTVEFLMHRVTAVESRPAIQDLKTPDRFE